MPHKRNPITAERLSGLARVVRGNALAALENVALWHERDISHSSAERIILPDSCMLLDYMLVETARPDREAASLSREHGAESWPDERPLFQPIHSPRPDSRRSQSPDRLRSGPARGDADLEGRQIVRREREAGTGNHGLAFAGAKSMRSVRSTSISGMSTKPFGRWAWNNFTFPGWRAGASSERSRGSRRKTRRDFPKMPTRRISWIPSSRSRSDRVTLTSGFA